MDQKQPQTTPGTPPVPTNLNDYYKSQNQALPSLADRGKLYETAGFGAAGSYMGSTDHNAALLGYLMGSSKNSATPPAQAPAPATPVTVSTPPPKPDPTQLPGGTPAAGVAPATAAAYRTAVDPGNKPALPSYATTYAKLRADNGVSTLEDEVSNLQLKKDKWMDQLASFKTGEEKGATSGAVYGARVSEEQRNIQDQVDIVDRQINLAQNNLKTKNDFISNMMNWTQSDYSNASHSYETELSKNIQVQNYVDTQATKLESSARANLSSITNLISTSGKAWKDVPATLRNQISGLELQAGFPPGTIELFSNSKPRANIILSGTASDDKGKYAYALMQDPNGGSPSVVKTYIGGPDSSAGTTLTLSEARTLGLPASLVGKSEQDIGKDLSALTPPVWFKNIDEDYKNLDERALQSEWDDFRKHVLENRSI